MANASVASVLVVAADAHTSGRIEANLLDGADDLAIVLATRRRICAGRDAAQGARHRPRWCSTRSIARCAAAPLVAAADGGL